MARLLGDPRISRQEKDWQIPQRADLLNIWRDVQRVINSNAVIVDSVIPVAKTGDIAATPFTEATPGALYRVNYYLETVVADGAAGAVTLTFAFTDDAGATTIASSALSLAAQGRTSGIVLVRLASGSLTYAITHTGSYGTATYSVQIVLERIA